MIAALVLETRLSERQLLEDTSDEVLDAMLEILRERAEKAEDEQRQAELKRKFG